MFGTRCKKIVAVAVTGVLSLTPLTSVAQAKTSQEVYAEADAEAAHLAELSAQVEEGRAQLEEFDAQINDLADQSIEMQGELIQDREQLHDMMSTTYRWGTPSVWEIALSSNSLEDFTSRLYYAQKVTDWQTDCVEQLKDDKRELEKRMDKIEKARADRQKTVDELDAASQELSDRVAALLAQAQTLEEEERKAEEARLAELKRQAEAEKKRKEKERARAEAEAQARADAAAAAQAAQEQAAQEQAAQEAAAQEQPAEEAAAEPEAEPAAEPEQAAEPEPEPVVEPEPEPEPEPVVTEDAGDWITCVASAYTIADNTPPGSTATSSGIPLDESVPTVAMPMSISPARFYGERIQIEYEGMTVIATITDCGDLSGGARGLDLTPAVFRAFGFSTADGWGLRTVRYRFL